MATRLHLAAAALAVGSAFALYAIKHDTRLLELRVQAQERSLDKLEVDIAVIKAERAWLGRPERIEALARGAGLRPIAEGQYQAIQSSATDGISQLLRSGGGEER